MRAIIALVLLLTATSAQAADPWGDRLKQVFPSARVIETFDDYQPWLAYNIGHSGAQTTRLPVRMDGSPGQVWYFTNAVTRTEYAIKDHGVGNSVTGQSLMLSYLPVAGGVTHLAYQFGTATPQSGLKEVYIFWRMKYPHNVFPTSVNSSGVAHYDPAAPTYHGSKTPKFASVMNGLTSPKHWNYVLFGVGNNPFPREPYGTFSTVPQMKAGGSAVPGYQTLQLDYRDTDWGTGLWPGPNGDYPGAGTEQPANYQATSPTYDRNLYPRDATGLNGEGRGFQTDVWFGFEMRLKLVDEAMGADEMQLWYYTPEGVKTELFSRHNMWLHNIGISSGHTWNAMFLGGNNSNGWFSIDETMTANWYADDLIVNSAPIGDAYFAELAAYKAGDTVIAQPATYYVSPTGSDSNDGKTPQTAWQTIAKVNTVDFSAGEVIRFNNIGDYGTTTLTPKTSGSASGNITFTSYAGAATKPIFRGGVNLNGRDYVTIDGLDVTSAGITVSMAGATHNIISKCNIYSTAASWSPTISVRNGSHYNQIIGNTISQAPADNDIINLRNDADHNLIADNTITIQNSHAAIDIEGWTIGYGDTQVGDRSGNYNIIRGNKITGHNGGGVHITIQANSFHNVIDNNELKGDNTVGNYCYLTDQPARSQALVKGVGEYNIIRNNRLSNYPCQDSEGLFFDTYTDENGFTNNAFYNHIYHNVVTGIGSGATGLYFGVATGGTHNNNVVKNNIFANNGGLLWSRDADGLGSAGSELMQMRDSLDSNFYDNNIFYTSATNGAVVYLGSNYQTVSQADAASTKWTGNLQVNPLLDAATFLPNTGSPALNGGANLTTITSASGSGNTFTVADAYYFSDGNGVTKGDVIEVNNQQTAITGITYGTGLTGTLTVSPAITWTQGMGVNLPFNGTAPPVGLSLAPAVPDDGGDHTAPTTYARPGEGWPLPLTFATSEPNVATYYTTDGTDPRTSPTRTTYITGSTIIINVTTTVRFYSQDVAGNAEEPQSVLYTIIMPEPPKKPTVKASGRATAR